MTELTHTVPGAEPPSAHRHHATRPRSAENGGGAAAGDERVRDAEDRANQAEARASSAEGRAEQAEERAEAGERRIEALLRALDSRAQIDQAKGVIMGAFDISAEAAFDALVWVSQQANVKLAVVADRFLIELRDIDTGQPHRDELTRLLASMGRHHGEHFR
ncbi:ANTAR domain-containing protein [Actinomycetospora endophytica]|uniref:ANTAR domain-containing protein n=1 Tax=Actinomycetospora endophytica TaxID=2291215 RepID=A0ABS8PFH7_9PSEU|nr:ANTAR domain-containing protein [Actinomycetospora endophytica]MCD2196265.1 ANTAR domain-containing protein [Actinomycetospora endophytica]